VNIFCPTITLCVQRYSTFAVCICLGLGLRQCGCFYYRYFAILYFLWDFAEFMAGSQSTKHVTDMWL